MGVEITIYDALGTLDPENDAQWTEEGLPRMDVIETLVDDKSIIRKQVTDADPEFSRMTAAHRRVEKAIAESEAKENQDEPEVQEQQTQTETKEVNSEEKLVDQVLGVGKEISTLMTERAEVDKAIDTLRRLERSLLIKTAKAHSPEADTKARMAFIRSQAEQRAKRYEKGRTILALIGKDGLNPQSQIDQAMRRKTARGTKRPTPRKLRI